ncbi:beta-galactosidase GalB [Desertivirga brevis]|uniref:beta-galactosidase GalB n=1 Tax=Desertivirga brevis TaxID=2810310 RepID=UPI001A97263E|nr:beta-galactosidase GalB [Pedobacter sp. SYSU D00873]
MHKHRLRIIFLIVPLLFQLITARAQNRVIQNFDKGWKFYLGDEPKASDNSFDDSKWRSLSLPHDWSIEGKFDEKNPAGQGGGALPGGIGWYRKAFTMPSSSKGRSVFIDFGGVYRNSEVWINGKSLGTRPNGYISFRYDLTPYLNYGSTNIISVRVDNAEQPNSRWYSGSGIYRSVYLTTTGKVFVDNWGTFITTPKVTQASALVNIQTKVRNTSKNAGKAVLITEIYSPKSKLVTSASSSFTLSDDSKDFVQSVAIPNPSLWSDVQPHLYKAVTKISIGGRAVDSYETTFGIRSFNFDASNGFSLNGKKLKIRGVCNHHDLGALGAAFNVRAAERQLELLKEMGCNGIRTSHNPPAPELLDLCDKMGFIVMDESFDLWKKGKNPFDYSRDWDKWHVKDLEDQVFRDRNHPSVFIWSVGNEIQEQWGDEAKGDTSGREITRELVGIVKRLDKTRPVTTANNEVNPWNNLIKSGALDIIGYNYNHSKFKDFHKTWGIEKKFIVTESVSALQTRGHYDMRSDSIRLWPPAWDKPLLTGNPDLTCSAYDNCHAPWGSTHEETLKEFERLDHVSGMYIWTGFDYLGEPTPYPWPARSSYFGIIDLAGFPKDSYYMYQSVWTKKPVLHLLPHWNWTPGQDIDVWAYYNNADEVELFLNGRSLGSKSKTDDYHVMWRVKYEPGVLKAVSRKDGKVVLTRQISTAGKPTKIVLTADRSKIKADGKDLSFITAKVEDNNGNMIPDAEHLITFKVQGEAEVTAVDNGSPTSMESFKANYRKAFNGLALAIIRSMEKKGKVVVEAGSAGLQSARIELELE